MAGGLDLGSDGQGRRKSLDTAINLVPFIDLMAVTLSFLIMTAVWSQTSRLKVKPQGGDTEPAPAAFALPIDLAITEQGFSVVAGGQRVDIPKVDGRYHLCRADEGSVVNGCDASALFEVLRRIKDQAPLQRTITLHCSDSVRYEDLVSVIDLCSLREGESYVLFPEVVVAGPG